MGLVEIAREKRRSGTVYLAVSLARMAALRSFLIFASNGEDGASAAVDDHLIFDRRHLEHRRALIGMSLLVKCRAAMVVYGQCCCLIASKTWEQLEYAYPVNLFGCASQEGTKLALARLAFSPSRLCQWNIRGSEYTAQHQAQEFRGDILDCGFTFRPATDTLCVCTGRNLKFLRRAALVVHALIRRACLPLLLHISRATCLP
jgi:hypothetical protein